MSTPQINGWQDIRDEVLRRIHARTWKPGDLIPNETDLAAEFGCARATVNRALQALAEAGTLDRKRKAGTRVALQPVARATLNIPVIRREIEDRDLEYGYSLRKQAAGSTPEDIVAAMKIGNPDAGLHVVAVHLADQRPYAIEDRWISLETVPEAATAPFERISPNEWLIENIPYTHGKIAFSASSATPFEADALDCNEGDALFVVERLTWDRERAITRLRLSYAPGHRMHTGL